MWRWLLPSNITSLKPNETYTVPWIITLIAVYVDEDICNLIVILGKFSVECINPLVVREVPGSVLLSVPCFDHLGLFIALRDLKPHIIFIWWGVFELDQLIEIYPELEVRLLRLLGTALHVLVAKLWDLTWDDTEGQEDST